MYLVDLIGGIFSLVVFLVIAVLFIIMAIYIVPQQRVVVIERLGKFNKISSAGIHIKIPIIDKIAGKIDLRTQQEIISLNAKTQDNVTIDLAVATQYKIDSKDENTIYSSFYSLANPIEQMRSYIKDSLRSSIPNYSLDKVFEEKDAISLKVKEDVSNTMAKFGYIIVATLIQDISLPKDVEVAMNDINAAERKKVAAQSLADAEKIKVVTEAEAKATAAEQAGKGVAAQRTAIAEGINNSIEAIKKSGLTVNEANYLFLYTQWTDMMTDFAKNGKASTVVLPSDFNDSASMFDSVLAAKVATPEDIKVEITEE